MKIQESAEDYLESILIISEKKEFVRAIDIVNHLGISKPSVSVYLKNLRENGYVNIDDKGHLSLTDTGLSIAEKIYERHKIISSLLMSLGVNEDIALKDACKIEHDLSDETFYAIKNYYIKSK
ncbi:MAG: metal-dependent transcriptional regulator [Lachnospiraceae bacterium]|nr:metal-dependent transcriptional regulator [Lachnospiraceae bacterium]